MIDVKATRKRAIKAMDNLVSYLPYMKEQGDKIFIQRKETYVVDMTTLTCTCHDYGFHGRVTPCKHLFMALAFRNAINHEEQDMLP